VKAGTSEWSWAAHSADSTATRRELTWDCRRAETWVSQSGCPLAAWSACWWGCRWADPRGVSRVASWVGSLATPSADPSVFCLAALSADWLGNPKAGQKVVRSALRWAA
jgi:hypothetical protein